MTDLPQTNDGIKSLPGSPFAIDKVHARSMYMGELIDFILSTAEGDENTTLTYINAHCMNLAHRDEEYRNALDQFDIVYPDGMSIVWAGRYLGYEIPERLSAGDYIYDFGRQAAERNLSVFLLGGYKGMMPAAAARLISECPGLEIAGVHNGFFHNKDTQRLIEKINSSGAKILIVGMSAPVQEKWILQNIEKLNVPVIWCVGALMEYVSGRTRRCPQWMSRIGMEWLFRLLVEPKRMWRRYLVGNVEFAMRVMREKRQRGN